MTELRFLLDTNICIYVLADAASAASRRLGECAQGTTATSAISYAEVMLGLSQAGSKECERAEAFFALLPILPFTEAAARAYASLPFRRTSYDRLIAAHALALDLVLITNNPRDFADVAGLKIENWTQP